MVAFFDLYLISICPQFGKMSDESICNALTFTGVHTELSTAAGSKQYERDGSFLGISSSAYFCFFKNKSPRCSGYSVVRG